MSLMAARNRRAEGVETMLRGIKTLGTALAVSAMATAAVAAMAAFVIVEDASITITAPDSVKVGTKFSINVLGLSARMLDLENPPPPGDDPTVSAGPIFMTVHVYEVASKGKDKKKLADVFVEIENHEWVEFDVPLEAEGYDGGAWVIVDVLSETPEGPQMVHGEKFIPYTKGNGTPK
jgi:hypothetical protein